MKTLQIELLNPKAERLLKDLAALNLIAIQQPAVKGFDLALKKLRSKSKSVPTLEEITQEVEFVRARRYDR